MSILLSCFSLLAHLIHVVQAPCRALKRPLSDSSTSSGLIPAFSRKRNEAYLNVHRLMMKQKMPETDRWRRVFHCQFRATGFMLRRLAGISLPGPSLGSVPRPAGPQTPQPGYAAGLKWGAGAGRPSAGRVQPFRGQS